MPKEIKPRFNRKEIVFLALAWCLLIVLSFLTKYYGSTDIPDYSDTAKYFAGDYSAKIRSSHSYLYGFIHFPSVKLFSSFFFFKISSILCLFLLVLSIYIMSRSKNSLYLLFLSPVIWYMAPWVSPIQLASLFFIWAFYFINRFDIQEKLRYLLYSGIFLGLAFSVWDTIFFFGMFLAISFLFNKKLYHSLFFLMAIFIGLTPRLILDLYLFGFPFYSMLKSIFGTFANVFGGIYGAGMFNKATTYTSTGVLALLFVFLSIPFYFWTFYNKNFWKNNKKSLVFLSLSLLLIVANPQIRYTLVIVPIIFLLISKELEPPKFKKQMIFSAIILTLFFIPVILQIFYSVDGKYYADITYISSEKKFNIFLDKNSQEGSLVNDLRVIEKEYPGQTFIVGPGPDDYGVLARLYWGKNVKEFVSIQDYGLWKINKTSIFEKILSPTPRIEDRRQIWIAGGMSKSLNDRTDYSRINYAISLEPGLDLEGFKEVKRYSSLTLYEKE